MKPTLLVLIGSCMWGQVRIPGPGGVSSPSAGSIGIPAGTAFSSSASGGTSTSSAHTTFPGDLLFAYWSEEQVCTNYTNASAFSAALSSVVSDTGGDAFVSIIPPTGASLIGMHMVTAGSGCGTVPSCTVSGGGGTTQATCNATSVSGGSVTGMSLLTNGAGYTSAPTITFTGGGCSVEPTATPTVYGIGNTLACSAAFYAKNVTGTTNNQVSVVSPAARVYHGISVSEVSGLNAAAPLDTVASATSGAATSITSSLFSTVSVNEIALCGSRVENAAAQTWVPGNIGPTAGSLVSGSIPGGNGAANNFIATEYELFSSTQSMITAAISSGSSAARLMICGVFEQ